MLPANSLVVKCPDCQGKKELLQLRSGNTFGTQLWSDSKQIAPMLPRVSPVQKCTCCGRYYLLSRIDRSNMATGTNCSFETGWLTFEEAIEANKDIECLSIEEQSTMAIVTIWAYNDIIRENNEPSTIQQETYKNYISNLLNIPRIFDDNILLRAELYREISEFEKCLSTLEGFSVDDDFIKGISETVVNKAKIEDSKVFKIQ
mgnify:FL=1